MSEWVSATSSQLLCAVVVTAALAEKARSIASVHDDVDAVGSSRMDNGLEIALVNVLVVLASVLVSALAVVFVSADPSTWIASLVTGVKMLVSTAAFSVEPNPASDVRADVNPDVRPDVKPVSAPAVSTVCPTTDVAVSTVSEAKPSTLCKRLDEDPQFESLGAGVHEGLFWFDTDASKSSTGAIIAWSTVETVVPRISGTAATVWPTVDNVFSTIGVAASAA